MDAKLNLLAGEYAAAQIAVLIVERTVLRLADEGDHKKKNKVIWTELRKKTLERNAAARRLMDYLNGEAEQMVEERFPESWTG